MLGLMQWIFRVILQRETVYKRESIFKRLIVQFYSFHAGFQNCVTSSQALGHISQKQFIKPCLRADHKWQRPVSQIIVASKLQIH